MLDHTKTAAQKRETLKKQLKSGKLLAFPGAFSPLVAREIARVGFDGVYISGAALAADLGLPDIGLTTLSEITTRGGQIANASDLPAIIDADTGFGEALNAARTIWQLEQAGLAGCHMEDQENPKRCGHLDNKKLVPTAVMVQRLQAAVKARHDENFVLIARTDANGVEGLDAAINRAKAYVDAGADMIFPEALSNEAEFAAFRAAVSVPLLANMTEFGKSSLLDRLALENLGYNMVIYPVTTLRLAMYAVGEGLRTIKNEGTQESLLGQMQHRQDLYKLLNYEGYNALDADIYNFKLKL
ncbi:MAG: methylisocitrate lyase [Alphaproteobacteria bacterium]